MQSASPVYWDRRTGQGTDRTLVGYDVRFMLGGEVRQVRLPFDPGASLRVNGLLQPVDAQPSSPRYEYRSDGVADTGAGLLWAAEANTEGLDWREANRYCESLGRGWRLPASDELIALEWDAMPHLYSDASHWTRDADGFDRAFVVYRPCSVCDGGRYSREKNNGARKSVVCVRPL